MNNYVQSVYPKLLQEIEALTKLKSSDVRNPLQVGELVQEQLAGLKNYFKSNPFVDQANEISFFKYEKPSIVAELIFAQELYSIESSKPIGDKALTDNFYGQELNYIRRVFDQNRFLYQYFQLDGTEFDEIFFCRGNRKPEINLPVEPDADPEFSTPGDFAFAKFIAFERLQNHLADILYADKSLVAERRVEPLQWTGDLINIVELIYGLYLTGQINHGNISINELVRWAEKELGVKIGVIQRKLAEIQGRKRISATKFIDQMRNSLSQKLDDMSA
ncbi:MAG: RteC domain-containing protein [Bacteroidetes bacterium]|nr:RteC domain-containing protein [Bacteroidota bacterium]